MNIKQKLYNLKNEDTGLFVAACMVIGAGVLSIVRLAIVLARFFSFDPTKVNEDELWDMGFYDLVNENSNSVERVLDKYGFAQYPLYIRITLYVIITLFVLAFLIMYIRSCRQNHARVIPGVFFLLLMPTSVAALIIKKISRDTYLTELPYWVAITGLVIAIIAFVIMCIFTFQDKSDFPFINAKFYLISVFVCCLIIPGLAFIAYIVAIIVGLLLLLKIGDILHDAITARPHTVTITDHETGQSFTIDKDNVKIE